MSHIVRTLLEKYLDHYIRTRYIKEIPSFLESSTMLTFEIVKKLSVICVFLTIPLTHSTAAETPESIAFFEKKIRPVLVTKCYECHSAEAAKNGELGSGLQLDTREGIRRGGDTGASVVPGKPSQSLLLAAIRHERDLEMPPDSDPLKASVIADFEKWINMGAPDPRDGKPVAVGLDFDRARAFWSLQPIRKPALPEVKHQQWPRTGLDYFVSAKREAKQIPPANDAPRSVLLRRLFFDLIGLPPTPEELHKFQSVPVVEVVDYLLVSPHFGERWGRHWLDVARYAESNGLARNMAWQHAWRYRDWVIDAFNSDLPYNQFIALQIAGDLMPAKSREEQDRQTIATGFLALGPKSLEERKRELFLMDSIDEQIDVICRGILGLSVSCARCHDHKFDPVPTADYYALVGILRSTDTQYGIGPMGIKGVNDSGLIAIGADADKLSGPAGIHLKQVQDQTQKRNTARSDRYRVVRRVADHKRKLSKPDEDKEKLKQEIAKMDAEIKDWDQRIKKMDEDLANMVAHPPAQPEFTMGARDYPKPIDTKIRVRGEVTHYGEVVPRGVLRAIEVTDLPKIGKQESGRLQLAKWLTSRENPLTARVLVNRVWQQLFERGLVSTPDDFGVTGSKPTHPLLLDYLAAKFMEQNWSVKTLIREIVLSRTYQMSSDVESKGRAIDPDNLFLWYMPLRRLDVESFRDALLAVSGRLKRERREGSAIQQIGVFSEYEFNSRTKLTPEMMASDHRSIYLPIVRGNLPEMLQLFDFADPNSLVGQRDQTTVPSQALFLMNSAAMIDFSRKTANRLLEDKSLDHAQRLNRLYELALSRKATKTEQAAVFTFLAGDQGLVQISKDTLSETEQQRGAWLSVCQALLASSEFRHIK